jgi:TP901 family phage tail tape measure protein
METIFKLGIMLSVVDMLTGPVKSMGQAIDGLRAKAGSVGPVFDKMVTYGKYLAGMGAVIVGVLGATALATAGTQKALGELASMGVTDMAAMERAASDFSNQCSGTTKAQFIASAYDIRSGISSLSDQGVADFTYLAALTGKATKGTTAEMTSLFASGYNIYKGMYANLTDLQFGEVFSAGISASVKQFKATGSSMAQAISTLGATATTAKRPLEEQLAILGMLQATMSGSEAGTKYRAIMQMAAGAGQKLGISLTDSNKQLLSMPEILNKLHGKYGATLDAAEKMQIQAAFGSQEAVAVIDLFYDKVGELTSNINLLGTAQRQGTAITEQMAQAMNKDIGGGIMLLGQQWSNLQEVIGKQLLPVLVPLFAGISRVIVKVQQFAEKHATLTKVAVLSLAVLGALGFLLGGLGMALGTVGMMAPAAAVGLTNIGKAFTYLQAGLLKLIPAIWSFTLALLANPITWVVVGVIALVAGLIWLYRNFEGVRNAVKLVLYVLGYFLGALGKIGKEIGNSLQPSLDALLKGFRWLGVGLKEAFMQSPFGDLIKSFIAIEQYMARLDWRQAGAKIVETLAAGIKAATPAPVKAVFDVFSLVGNLLPHSDAKEGPFSQLTLSGARIMETLGAGVTGAAPGLHKTVAAALAGAALTTSIAVTPMPAQAVSPNVQTVTGSATWQAQPVAAPAVQDLAGAASWQAQQIKAPVLPDLTASATWQPQMIEPPATLPGQVGQVDSLTPKPAANPAKAAGKTIIIQHLEVTIPGVTDGEGFVRELQRLVEEYDAA